LDRAVHSDAVLGRAALIEVASDAAHPQRVRAAEALPNRGGFHTMSEHRVKVEH
jgi:hypothetical protein